MTLRRHLIFAAVFALLVAACSSASSTEQSFSETPSALTIRSGTGNVTISAEDSAATVTAEVNASGEEPEWSATLSTGELVIDDGCGDRTDCEVNLVIEVAATADVTIDSADGGITIADMNSALTVRGAASNVLLNGITGPITVDLTEGDLLGARLVSTDASFRTGDGNLDVTLTEPFTSLSVTSGSGDVTAQVPNSGYAIDASTGSGSVEINVSEDDSAAAMITMRTESGDVTIYRR